MKKSRIEYFTAKKAGTAINRYDMIGAGDKVLVGVSGGKDSLTLLKILLERKKWLPIDYDIKAVHVMTDYDIDAEKKKRELEGFFKKIKCGYLFKEIKIRDTNKLKREDCFWCSWNRRKTIFELAEETGFTKIAFGHHKDDVAETILMNMFFNSEISSINPVQTLFKGKITVIRPLVLLEEKEISEYSKKTSLPVVRSTCPRNKDSKRMLIKEMLSELHKENKEIKNNIINSTSRIREDYLGLAK